MNDRELLEMAAKAAGYHVRYVSDGDGVGSFYMEPSQLWWSPLIDDGDALRLAVALGLRIFPYANTSTGYTCSAVADGANMRLSDVIATGDTDADVRRAIVMAAANLASSG